MTASIIPVILSGGSGTRLWPLSRKLYPKQFIPITGDKSLFQTTVERVRDLENVNEALVICNDEHRFMAAEQLRRAGLPAEIILEPAGRNTAPAITIAAMHALDRGPDVFLLVLPADHIVQDVEQFRLAVSRAVRVAADRLVTFGIVPDRAETGYGYIRYDEAAPLDPSSDGIYEVQEFVEKPDSETAGAYLESGRYLWNSGLFLFSAGLYLSEVKRLQAEIFEACREAYAKRKRDLDFVRLDGQAFSMAPGISVDYAVMERTDKAAVTRLDCGWSDIGSWQALWESMSRDGRGNVTSGDVVEEDCEGCYIRSSHRLVTTVGTRDLAVIETADAVLVASRERAQEVRDIVVRLQEDGRSEAEIHSRVYRPWGAYEILDTQDSFQVKRITVNPGQSLSLQMHRHRDEHWIVVKGTARVTRDEEVFLLGENESTYIQAGTRHRLENPGSDLLQLIEVQSGSYLGEDDIVRYEDDYGR